MSQKCVWVREAAVLTASRNKISTWEIWSAHNTKREALAEYRKSFRKRPKWVTAKFYKATNRIVKYVPASRAD